MLLALLALAFGGCGRLGYDPVRSEVAVDGGAIDVAASALDAGNPPLPPRRPRGSTVGGFSSAPRPPRFP